MSAPARLVPVLSAASLGAALVAPSPTIISGDTAVEIYLSAALGAASNLVAGLVRAPTDRRRAADVVVSAVGIGLVVGVYGAQSASILAGRALGVYVPPPLAAGLLAYGGTSLIKRAGALLSARVGRTAARRRDGPPLPRSAADRGPEEKGRR